MRIPNYLRLAPSGIWHFRQRLSAAQVGRTGQVEVTRSLRTRDLLTAQQRALVLVQAYAQPLTIRGLSVAKDGVPTVSEILGAKRLEEYRLVRRLDGSIEMEANGKEDHGFAMDALERIGRLDQEPCFRELMQAQASRAAAASPIPALDPASKIPVIAIGKAVTQWLAEIKSSTRPKTFKIKTAAVEGFAKHYGEKSSLKEAGRIDVGNWVQALRAGGLQTPTIVNKCSYLRGFFDWAKARGYCPSFTKDENPAAGQVVYGTREKRKRRALGFKPFTREQIQALYASSALEGLSESARWGTWVGLYTGARVAEVGQLALSNFVEVDGIPCLYVTDEGEGQSVKNDASVRTIPIPIPSSLSLACSTE